MSANNIDIKRADGAIFTFTLDHVIREFKNGRFSGDCQASPEGTQQWTTLRLLLDNVGELQPQTPEERANRTTLVESAVRRNAMSRYKDAYFVAGSVSGIGAFIKIVGCIIAVVFIFAFLVLGAASKSTPLIFGGIGIATSVGVPIYILGVLVSAIGQHTKATMDCAVHTSPFLSDPEKAEVMSIR